MGSQVEVHAMAFGKAMQKGHYLRRVVGPLLVITYALVPWTDSPCCQEALIWAGGLWLLYATFQLPYDFLHEFKHARNECLANRQRQG